MVGGARSAIAGCPQSGLRVALVVTAALGCASGCSSDLFHTTDWKPKCDDAAGCDATAASTSSASVSAAASSGAGGGLGGGGGAVAASTGTGAGGQGGTGGGSTCATCGEAIMIGAQMSGPLCMGSIQLYGVLVTCACANQGGTGTCGPSCQTNVCAGGPIDSACTACLALVCGTELMNCTSDSAH